MRKTKSEALLRIRFHTVGGCIPWNPSDLNQDGCVDVNDFIGHLAAFGTGCEECEGEYDECGVCDGPGATYPVVEEIQILYDSIYVDQISDWLVFEVGADTTFSYICEPSFSACGDLVDYQGYEYATVQIGDQCWFAENLRASKYRNGDTIMVDIWEGWELGDLEGRTLVYGEVLPDEYDIICSYNSPDVSFCDASISLAECGRLYSWGVVVDSRKICPAGWHVPSDEEWNQMIDHLGGSALASEQLRSTYGWVDGLNGTNESGFNGLPGGGYRGYLLDGRYHYSEAGSLGWWWTSETSLVPIYDGGIAPNQNEFISMVFLSVGDVSEGLTGSHRLGSAIRCIKD